MEVMIFLALVYIAYHLPTEDQVQEIIRLLREMKEDGTHKDLVAPQTDVKPVKPKAGNKPVVDRRKR